MIFSEPSDIEEVPVIPGALKIHKYTQCPPTATGETQINFSFLSNSKEPSFTQKYATQKRCRHADHDFDSLAQFRSTCAYCMEKHIDASETQDWLRCPVDGLILLMCVLDLRLDNMFLIFFFLIICSL